MFSPFLKSVADDLLCKFDGNLKDLTIVLPSKRGRLFFNRYLAEITDHPVWSPAYTTMDGLFQSLSDLEVADQPLLIYHLYAAYCEAMHEVCPVGSCTTEDLDQFYSWGEVMLSDFDDIDNNLAHAEQIFTNMKDLDDLTTLDYLTDEQRKAIEHYFGIFNVGSDSDLKQKFISIWNLLLPTYRKLHDRLLKHRIAYQGMLRREVTEGCCYFNRLKSKKYVFVGFNVLNKTERLLLDSLQKEGIALFYWDYDKAYVQQTAEGDCFFEAGRYVRENLQRFGCEIPSDAPCYDNMSNGKHLTFVASPSNSGETRYAGEWIGQHVKADAIQHHTAVVLCDEKMLQSMLHSMPANDSDGHDYQMNVTMGFPLIQTPVAGLVMTLLDLHVYGDRNKYWYYTYVSNVLKHPYVVRMSDGESVRILNDIKNRNQFFVSPDLFNENHFLSKLFKPQNDIDGLLSMLSEVTQSVALSYVDADSQSFDIQLYQESLYAIHTLINRLIAIRAQIRRDADFLIVRENDMSSDRYLRLIRQIIQSASVPFHGEPAEGIQIIGLLETRCLDFEHVIIAGMNDENIPKAVKRSSFIPYTLREAHGLTTFEARASLYAYSFYHLIQRASDVTLIYNSTVDALSKGEMSRFMSQLLVEQDSVFCGQTYIEQTALEAKVHTSVSQPLFVKKTKEVIDRLGKRFSDKILSPSAINTYINCPFKFYLEKVAGLKADGDITEEVGNDVFGNIFHYCMEQLYRPYIGTVLPGSLLEKMSKEDKKIGDLVDEGFRELFFRQDKNQQISYNGEQKLNRTVIIKYVKKQLEYDALLCPMRIEGVENEDHKLKIEINGHSIVLGGIIDRIDTIHVGMPQERHRIVDYKTSSTAMTFKVVDELFDSMKEKRPYHILQTFYYSDIYTNFCSQPVAPALMYIKPASTDRKQDQEDESIIRYDNDGRKEAVIDFARQLKEDFHQRMMAVIEEMFNPEKDFDQTENLHTCTNCDFRQICNR